MTQIKESQKNRKNSRIVSLSYLKHTWKTVAKINTNGEYEISPSKYCKEGDTVWILEDNDTFTKTKIY